MSKTRTDYRKERRDLIKDLIDKLWLISNFDERDKDKIKVSFLHKMQLDLADIIKVITYGERYIGETHIYTNGHGDAGKSS